MINTPRIARRTAAALVLTTSLGLAAAAGAADSTVSTFTDANVDGWVGSSGAAGGIGTFVDEEAGTPAPSLHTIFHNFGIAFTNDTADWTGNYTQSAFTISTDINSQLVNFWGMDTTRDWILELRDYDNAPEGMPYVSVWYDLGDVYTADTGEVDSWRTLSVTVDDPTQAELPAGWGGYGAEDPETYEPILPADRTFASVLAGVDEIAFSTYTPGFFYSFTDYDIAIDNVSLQFIPEPTGLGALAIGGLFLRRRR